MKKRFITNRKRLYIVSVFATGFFFLCYFHGYKREGYEKNWENFLRKNDTFYSSELRDFGKMIEDDFYYSTNVSILQKNALIIGKIRNEMISSFHMLDKKSTYSDFYIPTNFKIENNPSINDVLRSRLKKRKFVDVYYFTNDEQTPLECAEYSGYLCNGFFCILVLSEDGNFILRLRSR